MGLRQKEGGCRAALRGIIVEIDLTKAMGLRHSQRIDPEVEQTIGVPPKK